MAIGIEKWTHSDCWVCHFGRVESVVLVHETLSTDIERVDGLLCHPLGQVTVFVELAAWIVEY